MHVVIGYFSDNSSKPAVTFCDTPDQAIATVAEITTNGAMTTVYAIEDNLGVPEARIVYGQDLRGIFPAVR